MKTAKIIEVLKDFRALKPLEQVNQLEYYAEVIHSLHELPTKEEIRKECKRWMPTPLIVGGKEYDAHIEGFTKAITNLLER